MTLENERLNAELLRLRSDYEEACETHFELVHPVPHALTQQFNTSRACVRAPSQRYGLLRVNVLERCYNVQARIFGYWKEMADAQPPPSRWWLAGNPPGTRWLDARQENFLRAAASVYRRCYGLEARLRCPRVVGDLTLSSKGVEAACLRSPSNSGWETRCPANDVLPTPPPQQQGARADARLRPSPRRVARAQVEAFECAVDGLRQISSAP